VYRGAQECNKEFSNYRVLAFLNLNSVFLLDRGTSRDEHPVPTKVLVILVSIRMIGTIDL
jgi:hypothetical protein